MTNTTDTPAEANFAWTPGTGAYKFYPSYVNLTGNRLTLRGPEDLTGEHPDCGQTVAVELPDEALAELRAALNTRARGEPPQATEGEGRCAAQFETSQTLPICVRLREQVHTGGYYSDGYGCTGPGGLAKSRPATPMMRAANRDGPEAADIIEQLYEALDASREYIAAVEGMGVFIAKRDSLADLDTLLSRARGEPPQATEGEGR